MSGSIGEDVLKSFADIHLPVNAWERRCGANPDLYIWISNYTLHHISTFQICPIRGDFVSATHSLSMNECEWLKSEIPYLGQSRELNKMPSQRVRVEARSIVLYLNKWRLKAFSFLIFMSIWGHCHHHHLTCKTTSIFSPWLTVSTSGLLSSSINYLLKNSGTTSHVNQIDLCWLLAAVMSFLVWAQFLQRCDVLQSVVLLSSCSRPLIVGTI